MTKSVVIAVDAMGGDNAPIKVLNGISEFLKNQNNIFFRIFGSKKILIDEISKNLDNPTTGFNPTMIPELSRYSRELIDFKKTDKDVSEEVPKKRSGEWDKFRSLLKYYEECLRNEEGADASAFIDDIGKKYLFVNGIGSWGPNNGDKWHYLIPMGEHIHDFQKQLSKFKSSAFEKQIVWDQKQFLEFNNFAKFTFRPF